MKRLKKVFAILLFILPVTLYAQEVTVYTYKQVPISHLSELLERESKYWSKVARKAIDDGKLTFWAVLVKQGVFDAPNTSNVLYVNTFKDIDDQAGVWNAQAVFPDVSMDDMDTWKPEFGHVMHQFYMKAHAWEQSDSANPDEDFNYLQMVYHKTDDAGTFIDIERDHWGPFIKEMMNSAKTPQVGWGNAILLGPHGTEMPFNSVSYDIYSTLGDALAPDLDESFSMSEEMQKAFSEVTHSDRNQVFYEIFAVESANNN